MPSATLFYFTGTGNTLALVQVAKETLVAAGWRVSLVNVAGSYKPETVDLVGVFFPVYSFGPPRIISRFIKRLPAGDATPSIVVANAAESAAGAAGMARRDLAAREYDVQQSYAVFMPSNYILGGEAMDDLSAAVKVARAVETVRQNTSAWLQGEKVPDTATGVSPFGAIAHWGFIKGLPFMGRQYRYNDKCTGCGACVEMCPVGVISLDANERPTWARGCEHCMRCVNHCPFDAIEVGRLTRGKRRYKYWAASR